MISPVSIWVMNRRNAYPTAAGDAGKHRRSGLQLAVCTGYRVGDEVYTEFPADLALLEQAEPVYEWFPGWQQSTQDARKLEDLPANARAYLDRLEALCETPIAFVSVGTRRDQIISVKA